MRTARHRTHLRRNWFRHEKRQPASRTARLATAAILITGAAAAVAVPTLTASPAAAATATTTQNFTTGGVYTVTVPDYLSSFSVTGLGGAGEPGQAASDNVSTGGSGGAGSYVTEGFATNGPILGGDTLQIVVGAGGGGGQGGTGDGIAGNGGAGGGVTTIYDETLNLYVLVAAGGGGGGGGSGLFPGYDGGNGGIDSGGAAGIGQYGGDLGTGGAEGTNCGAGGNVTVGTGGAGQNAPTASADGGGGGGGGGACGGSGGQAQLGSGGGGGGAGFSTIYPSASSSSLSQGANTGDGSASITFTTTTVAPTITSANCLYGISDATGHFTASGVVTTAGNPEPTLSLPAGPSWLGLGAPYLYSTAGGLFNIQEELLDEGVVADGEYTFPVGSSNSAGTVLEPLTLAVEPGNSPAFISAASATATAGQPFNFQATAVGCPPVGGYSVTGAPSWLSLNPETGALSGTPSSADAGTQSFTLTANLEGGTSVTQAFTLTVNPPAATAPGAPTIGTATAGNGQATVVFTPPASDGGSPITGYTVTATDATNAAHGGQTFTGTGSPITITGLTNGDSYTFTVTATNAAGTGLASASSDAVTPTAPITTTAPGAPSIGTANAGNGQATVAFTPPASNGGSPITGYTVTATDTTNRSHGGQTATGTGSSIIVTGLTNGDRYTFTVKATNAVGTGPASAPSNAVTPRAPVVGKVPGAPIIDAVTPGDGQAQIVFRAPASDGGSPITSYTVTATDLTHPSQGGETATGKGSPITVTRLTDGDRYTFTVKATNAVGPGPASAPSKTVTPEAPKPRADLTTALSRHPSATDGSTFTETVTVTNHGPSAAPNVVTRVIIPDHLSVVSTDGGKQAGAMISWTDPSLGVGQSVSYSVVVKVAAGARGTVLIAATIISAAVDPNPLNNWAITAVKLG